jgi:hypothetical protein
MQTEKTCRKDREREREKDRERERDRERNRERRPLISCGKQKIRRTHPQEERKKEESGIPFPGKRKDIYLSHEII